MPKEPIVAVGLLTASDLRLLGSGFDRLWPVDGAPCFSDLLQAIDEAEQALERKTGAAGAEHSAQ